MSATEKKIPFKLDLSRMLELLADQIYQSPLALLRENTQNAFDAIRMRQAISMQDFDPKINVTVEGTRVVVADNGIGMTSEEIETHFWYAGRSGKNTEAARSAGVVGTFGIGAMANFGVAEELSVESESASNRKRTHSAVRKAELSTEIETISVRSVTPKGEPGTTIKALLAPESQMSVEEARTFLREFVEFLDVPVWFNDELLSGASPRSMLPSERHSWEKQISNTSLSGIVSGNMEIRGMATGELRVVLENVSSEIGLGQAGSIVLLQGRNTIRVLRSRFGLATVAMQSGYQWGGVIDLPFLKPTAGREALDAPSNQLLQQIVSALDQFVSPIAAKHSESFHNDGFLRWIVSMGKFDLCSPLEVTPRPLGKPESLETAAERGGLRYYSGREESIIQTYASEDEPLVVLARRSPRRDCELGYFKSRGIQEVDTKPQVMSHLELVDLDFGHVALATRMARVLEEDYFLETEVRFGEISGGLAVLVTKIDTPVVIYLNPDSSSVSPLASMYREDFDAFGPFVKDFIRSNIFPRIANLVPSSTREGSEAFLRHLRSNREWFEYESEDKASLEDIFEELHAGRMTVGEAKRRLSNTDRSYVEVSHAGTASLASVIHELGSEIDENRLSDPFLAIPGIDRRDDETPALILTSETPVNGYRCFLAISERVQRDKGDFFLQPHSTDIVWGGRKVVFVFHHHSKRFGLYYDILCPGLVGSGSGGGPNVTASILTKNRTFIPIPEEIKNDFLPAAGERKRLEVRCDVLYLVES